LTLLSILGLFNLYCRLRQIFFGVELILAFQENINQAIEFSPIEMKRIYEISVRGIIKSININ
jgi:hypothetical protein